MLYPLFQRFAVQALQSLLSDHPTFQQQQEIDLGESWGRRERERGREGERDVGRTINLFLFSLCIEVATEWNEDAVKMCSSLFLSLLPLNHRLLNESVRSCSGYMYMSLMYMCVCPL